MKKLSQTKLKHFLETHPVVAHGDNYHDEYGHYWEFLIYKERNKYYMIQFCNGNPFVSLDKKIELTEVVQKQKIKTYWAEV